MNLSSKKLFLLDMDGTLYLEDQLFPGVLEFLALVKERGGRAVYMTNNSSRGIEDYLLKLKRLGIEAAAADFVTSTDATIELLRREYPGARPYVIGTRSFQAQLRQAGIRLTDRADDSADLLLAAFDRELNYQKLEDACRLLTRDIPYLATNPDWVCPVSFGFVPDCGSICEMLWRATGKRPRFIGKPQPEMVELALKRTGFRKEEALLIGDRLYTDIACGLNAGVDTAFVLSGEGREEDIAAMGIQPAAVYPDIAAILAALKGE